MIQFHIEYVAGKWCRFSFYLGHLQLDYTRASLAEILATLPPWCLC